MNPRIVNIIIIIIISLSSSSSSSASYHQSCYSCPHSSSFVTILPFLTTKRSSVCLFKILSSKTYHWLTGYHICIYFMIIPTYSHFYWGMQFEMYERVLRIFLICLTQLHVPCYSLLSVVNENKVQSTSHFKRHFVVFNIWILCWNMKCELFSFYDKRWINFKISNISKIKHQVKTTVYFITFFNVLGGGGLLQIRQSSF